MPVITCPACTAEAADNVYETPNLGDQGLLKTLLQAHLQAAHNILPAAQAAQNNSEKVKVEKPILQPGSDSDTWLNHLREWGNYKTVCKIPDASINVMFVQCCSEDLRHDLYGSYTEDQLRNLTFEQLNNLL